MVDWSNLKTVHIDTLKEIGNIGSGNAVTALSKMLGRPIKMRVPVVEMVEFKHTFKFLSRLAFRHD